MKRATTIKVPAYMVRMMHSLGDLQYKSISRVATELYETKLAPDFDIQYVIARLKNPDADVYKLIYMRVTEDAHQYWTDEATDIWHHLGRFPVRRLRGSLILCHMRDQLLNELYVNRTDPISRFQERSTPKASPIHQREPVDT